MLTRRRFLVSSVGLLGLAPWHASAFADGERITRPKRLLYFTSDSCPLCRAFEQIELQSLKAEGWQVGGMPTSHIQVVDVDLNREFADRFAITSVPALVCVEFDQEVRRWDAKYSFDRWTLTKVYTGAYHFPHYPLRAEWWTLDGTTDHTVDVMVDHLQSGHHADKFDRRWLEELTIDELHSLHSDDHEENVRWPKAVKRVAELCVQPADSADMSGTR